jgi:hypothetical protein
MMGMIVAFHKKVAFIFFQIKNVKSNTESTSFYTDTFIAIGELIKERRIKKNVNLKFNLMFLVTFLKKG